jgi:hypothetical protein
MMLHFALTNYVHLFVNYITRANLDAIYIRETRTSKNTPTATDKLRNMTHAMNAKKKGK